MKFTLQIDLGDDDMRGYNDICGALKRLAQSISDEVDMGPDEVTLGDTHIVQDINGNTVGTWEVAA
jgi:hypothetical protein